MIYREQMIQKANDQIDSLTVGDRILATLGLLVGLTMVFAIYDMVTFTFRLKAAFHEVGNPFSIMDGVMIFWLAVATVASFVFAFEVVRGKIKAPPTPWDN